MKVFPYPVLLLVVFGVDSAAGQHAAARLLLNSQWTYSFNSPFNVGTQLVGYDVAFTDSHYFSVLRDANGQAYGFGIEHDGMYLVGYTVFATPTSGTSCGNNICSTIAMGMCHGWLNINHQGAGRRVAVYDLTNQSLIAEAFNYCGVSGSSVEFLSAGDVVGMESYFGNPSYNPTNANTMWITALNVAVTRPRRAVVRPRPAVASRSLAVASQSSAATPTDASVAVTRLSTGWIAFISENAILMLTIAAFVVFKKCGSNVAGQVTDPVVLVTESADAQPQDAATTKVSGGEKSGTGEKLRDNADLQGSPTV